MSDTPTGQEPPSYPGDDSPQVPPGQVYYGQQPYQGQPAYGTVPAAPQQPWAGAVLPKHPNAMTAMILGIVGLASLVFCGGLLLVLSPFAWAIGSKSLREIDANPTRYSGRNEASAGRICGIIGTILLVISVFFLALFIGLIAIGTATSTVTSVTFLAGF